MSWENTWSRGPERNFAGDTCVHLAFATQAALTPSRPAAVFGDRMMTYSELEERSGRLAAYLQRRGARTGARIGLCAERSFEMLVGVLAIFKCGGICLPLDLSYPAEWVEFVLADARCDFILTYRVERPAPGVRRTSGRSGKTGLDGARPHECRRDNAGERHLRRVHLGLDGPSERCDGESSTFAEHHPGASGADAHAGTAQNAAVRLDQLRRLVS